jgi:hypothetical protein
VRGKTPHAWTAQAHPFPHLLQAAGSQQCAIAIAQWIDLFLLFRKDLLTRIEHPTSLEQPCDEVMRCTPVRVCKRKPSPGQDLTLVAHWKNACCNAPALAW